MSSEKVNLRQLTEIERAAMLACIDGIKQALAKQDTKLEVDGISLSGEIEKLSTLLSKNTVLVMEGVPPGAGKKMKVEEVSAEKFQALIGELPDDNPLEGL